MSHQDNEKNKRLRETIESLPAMTRDTAERARELAQWVHEKLCCAQNLPWEEGDICDDCLESAKSELMPMLTKVEAREQLAAWMVERSFSTGHGDTFEDLLKELDWQVKELRGARAATIEEIACFAETHYCIIDENSLSGYKVCERTKHPNEPFARAIRGIAGVMNQAALAQALQLEEKEGT